MTSQKGIRQIRDWSEKKNLAKPYQFNTYSGEILRAPSKLTLTLYLSLTLYLLFILGSRSTILKKATSTKISSLDFPTRRSDEKN